MSASRDAVATVARSQLRRHWRSLVALGLVAGLVGGVATAAFAGARRTATAYDRLVDASGFGDAYVMLLEADPADVRAVAASPAVAGIVDSRYTVGRHTGAEETVLFPVQTEVAPSQRFVLRTGRWTDPGAADEIVVSERLAGWLDIGVGDVWPWQALTGAEFADLLRDRWDGAATGERVDLRVVGVVRSPTDVVLADFPIMYGTPALDALLAGDGGPVNRGLWVDLADGATVEDLVADVEALAAEAAEGAVVLDLSQERKGLDRAVVVLVSGLLAFGSVTLLAGAVVLGQLVGRAVQRTRAERRILRELGWEPAAAGAASAAAGLLAVAVAAVSSALTATVGSSFTPVGVAAEAEPRPGIDLNPAFVLPGALLTALALALLGWFLTGRRAHVRPPGRVAAAAARGPRLGSGPVASVGAALAFGSSRRAGVDRAAHAGVIAGVLGLVAALVFSASLDGFVGDPLRWGWVADHEVEVPEPARDRAYAALDAAPEVEAYAELRGGIVRVEGRAVDAYWLDVRKGQLAPVVLDGRLPSSEGEVAAGPQLLDDLALGLGDTLAVDGQPRTVVGSALPFGRSDRSSHTSGVVLGGGAPSDDRVFTTALVRFADGVDPEAAARQLYGDLEWGEPGAPVEVVNLGALRPLPEVLAGVLAVTGLVALVQVALGLSARGRADLAVLRCLGMPRRRAGRSVLVAALWIGATALVVGVPLGVVAGRLSWQAVAATTDFAAEPRTPVTVAVLLLGLLAVVSALGAVAGALAVRPAPGRVLRSE